MTRQISAIGTLANHCHLRRASQEKLPRKEEERKKKKKGPLVDRDQKRGWRKRGGSAMDVDEKVSMFHYGAVRSLQRSGFLNRWVEIIMSEKSLLSVHFFVYVQYEVSQKRNVSPIATTHGSTSTQGRKGESWFGIQQG